ncbi:MAG: hypothetical protein ACOCRK_01230 [bacterium]
MLYAGYKEITGEEVLNKKLIPIIQKEINDDIFIQAGKEIKDDDTGYFGQINIKF